MRVAVCMSGEMRGLPRLREFKEYVVAPFEARGDVVDVFVHTRSDRWWSSSLLVNARVLCVEENRKLPTSLIISEANPKEAGDYETEDEGDHRSHLYQSYLQQYWSLARVGKLLVQTEQREGRYALVVRTRPDCYLKGPLKPEVLLDGKVHVPWNDWWPYEVGGRRVETVCDKFAIGPSTDMQLYLNKFGQLQMFCERHRIQGEAFTAWCLGGMRWVYDGEDTPWVRDGGIEVVQGLEAHKNSGRP